MIFQCRLGKEFWAEALSTAVYLANRLPTAKGVSPYERMYGKPPVLSHLRIFGCLAYVQHPKGSTTRKLDPRAWRGILLGYDELNWRSYRIYDPGTATVKFAVHVTFNENVFPEPKKLEEDEIEFEAEVLTPGTHHMRRAVDRGPDQVGGLVVWSKLDPRSTGGGSSGGRPAYRPSCATT